MIFTKYSWPIDGFGLASLFNGGLLMQKLSFLKNRRIRGSIPFPRELVQRDRNRTIGVRTHYDITARYASYDAMGTSPSINRTLIGTATLGRYHPSHNQMKLRDTSRTPFFRSCLIPTQRILMGRNVYLGIYLRFLKKVFKMLFLVN